MCGRFALTTPPEVLAEAFALAAVPDVPPRFNIAPTQLVAAVRIHDNLRTLDWLRWGLVPSWTRDIERTPRIINARAETAAVRASFRYAFRRRRCLVVASAFYEWRREDGRRQPFLIRMKGGGPFAFAGIWDQWMEPASHEPAAGMLPFPERDRADYAPHVLETCAIMTTEPNVVMREIHSRMPSILLPEHYETWLDPEIHDPDVLNPLLAPILSDMLEAYPVSSHVNSPANDDPACMQRITHRPAV